MLRLYGWLWRLILPGVLVSLWWRGRRQPGYRRHVLERLGWSGPDVGSGPLIWVHAVSVGETRAAQPLIVALLKIPGVRILLTHMTPTGRDTGMELFVGRYPQRVVQAYLPYDVPGATARFLRRWQPDLGLLMETEVWPVLCAQAQRLGVPLALVNARLSQRSLARGLRRRTLIAPALSSLACVVAQGHADARRLRELGCPTVRVAGNLKFDVSASPELIEQGRLWRHALGGRPVVVAASTRDGEEALLLADWQSRQASRQALLVLVPRHPQRFDEVAELVRSRDLSLTRRSEGVRGTPWAHADVVLGDSMGEMFAWYGMADVAIIGGTLLPFGGQNLIEACAAGCPVVIGRYTENFEAAAEQACAARVAQRVDDAPGAIGAALALLERHDERAGRADRAVRFAAEHRGATARTLAALREHELLPHTVGPSTGPTF